MDRNLADLVDRARIREGTYRHSPHLGQWVLGHRLRHLVRDTLVSARERHPRGAAIPLPVLEIGAGHGSYADVLLAAGATVTLAEMTPGSLSAATELAGDNDRFTGVLDRDAALVPTPGGYAVALAVSVLHHVPDYLALVDRIADRLAPGGTLLTIQDPLYYPRVSRTTRAIDRTAYVLWRLGQGDVSGGLRALRRRLRGEFPPLAPDTVTYYHVVRQGVDEFAVRARLETRFESVEVITYWSHHLGAMGPLAERIGLRNTFAVRAVGLRQ